MFDQDYAKSVLLNISSNTKSFFKYNFVRNESSAKIVAIYFDIGLFGLIFAQQVSILEKSNERKNYKF
jgi:hypothetical protein